MKKVSLLKEYKMKKYYCNKCNKEVKELNGNEAKELAENGSFVCSTCINQEMDETTLKIKFEENLSDNSIKMIKNILKDSLGFETEITEI